MMRRLLTVLCVVGACATLASVAAAAASSFGVGAARARTGTAIHSWPLTLSADPNDLTLAQVSFRVRPAGPLSARSLRLAVAAPFGEDYLAAAAPRPAISAGVERVLVLLVNRPTSLLDPVFVHVRLSARQSLGRPVVRKLADPLTRASGSSAPALCDLRLHGAALTAGQLAAIASHGAPLAGFDAAETVAQAYDLTCALPYASAFAHAIDPQSGEPPTPTPVPSPNPEPPHCTPCDPRPGYACPLAAHVSVCVAGIDATARVTRAGAQ
jgi:hypothetical protein